MWGRETEINRKKTDWVEKESVRHRLRNKIITLPVDPVASHWSSSGLLSGDRRGGGIPA